MSRAQAHRRDTITFGVQHPRLAREVADDGPIERCGKVTMTLPRSTRLNCISIIQSMASRRTAPARPSARQKRYR